MILDPRKFYRKEYKRLLKENGELWEENQKIKKSYDALKAMIFLFFVNSWNHFENQKYFLVKISKSMKERRKTTSRFDEAGHGWNGLST